MAARAISRRRWLLGAGGVALAIPLLESLAPRGAKAAPPPRRLVILFSPNGVPAATWAPTMGPGGEKDFTLSPILGPLEPYRDKLLVLRGIDMESSYHGVGDGMHLNGVGHALTGTELVEPSTSTYWGGGQSIDQRIAQDIGDATKLRSLELGVDEQPATIRARLAYTGPASPLPPDYHPSSVFERLFGEVTPERRAKRKSVLDAVSDDLATVEKQLGKADHDKLDAHLQAVREIEKKLDSGTNGCVLPTAPSDPKPSYVTTSALQLDLLAAALRCDLVRVVTLMWGSSSSNVVFDWLGIKDPHHTISHTPATDVKAELSLTEINRWYAGQMTALLDRLTATTEGAGTLLDSTAVLWINELSDGVIHTRRDMPYVLAGSCGGAFKTGRVVQFQSAKHNDLLVSLANAMEVPITTFGNAAYCSGPLAL